MIDPPERSPERDAAIVAVLPLVPRLGWTALALREAAGADADLLFPGGPGDLVEAYIDWTDRAMVAAARPALATLRTPGRVRALIAARLELSLPHRDAVRRAAGVLLRPDHAPAAARTLARTVETIWTEAGDQSADFSWYTKRATLAAVYSATLLYWLRDETGGEATLAFLDRRLDGVARLGKLRARLGARSA